MTKYTAHTWADGFGRWSARVDLYPMPDAGHFDPSGARQAARRAIQREILDRSPRGWTVRDLAPIRLEITANNELPSGNLASLTYTEKD